jgi:3-phosphoshikimate 1-carboxyvinyltransferase
MSVVHPVEALRGQVALPSSKPHGQRALVLAAMADGASELIDLQPCAETALLRDGCRVLGARIGPPGPDGTVLVGGGLRPDGPGPLIGVAGSGFALRTLLAVACLRTGGGPSSFTGQARLGRRPLGPLVDALRGLGARIEFPAGGAELHLVSATGPLRSPAGRVSVPTDQTSQFATALLLVGPYLDGGLRLRLPSPVHGAGYLRLTLDLMERFGAEAVSSADLRRIEVEPGRYTGRTVRIGRDATCLFSFAAAAVLMDSDLFLPGVRRGTDPLVDQAIEVADRLGVRIESAGDGVRLVSGPPPSRRVVIDAAGMPTLVPALAALACDLPAGLRVHGASHLRHHKTSRLELVLGELAKLGRRLTPTFVDGQLDGFVSRPAGRPTGEPLDGHGDHRLYLALRLAAMAGDRPVRLSGEETLADSFTAFPATVAALARPTERIS